MATKKLPTKKKTTRAPLKKSVPTKKSTAVVRTAHLKLRPETETFMTFRVNRETLYWVVLGLVVILFTLWVLDLQAEIMNAYDQIDANTSQIDELKVLADPTN